MDIFFHSVTFIGAGNVASHLAVALNNVGFQIHGVVSKNKKNAIELASKIGSKAINFSDFIPENSLIVVCVNDEAISEVVDLLPISNAVVYTSGNFNLNQLSRREKLGVFYPLQTFTKNKELDISKVPFLIESNDENFGKAIFDLATKISNHVLYANSEERKKLHLGAVFVNNFTNHLIYLSKQYIDSQKLNWEILKPLLEETINKLHYMEPFDAQTGPARRNDQKTINDHLQQLDGNSREIYHSISKSILETYQ